MSALLGRPPIRYNYGRAKIIKGCISLNGRTWRRKVYCDYMDIGRFGENNDRRRRLRVGQIRDFVVISYTHKNMEGLRGRVRPSTLQGEFMFARLRQFHPQPERDDNMWLVSANPSFRRVMKTVPVHELCSYLHPAPERSGRIGYMNLITVAVSFVNS
jgi:hypothetical protein